MSTAEYCIRYGTCVPDFLTSPPTMAEAGPSFHDAHEPSLFRVYESDMTSHRAIAEHCVCIGTFMPDFLAFLPAKAEACPNSTSTLVKISWEIHMVEGACHWSEYIFHCLTACGLAACRACAG